MSWESILKEHSYILSEWSNHCFFQILSLLVGPAAVLVKVSNFQNEFMISSYLPNILIQKNCLHMNVDLNLFKTQEWNLM